MGRPNAGHARAPACREDEPARKGIEEIRIAGERAAGLTRQLLAYSRRQVLKPQVIDLNASVTSMVPMLRRLIGENIELNPTLQPDDDRTVRLLAGEMLEMNGYTVLEARDGREALDLVRRHGHPIHLLLTDVVMPQMSGRQLAEGIASAHPGIHVLYMSGYTDGVIAHHGVLDDGVAYLQKPFTADVLARKVREVLDARAGDGPTGTQVGLSTLTAPL